MRGFRAGALNAIESRSGVVRRRAPLGEHRPDAESCLVRLGRSICAVDRRTPTVSELVRRAVEVSDPEGRDPALGRLEEQLEDDDEPVTAVENLEERLALAAEGADYEDENPAVAVATAVVLYLASKQGQESYDRDPSELRRLAVRAGWHGDPPSYVADWLGER
jgi:hypothetical protein